MIKKKKNLFKKMVVIFKNNDCISKSLNLENIPYFDFGIVSFNKNNYIKSFILFIYTDLKKSIQHVYNFKFDIKIFEFLDFYFKTNNFFEIIYYTNNEKNIDILKKFGFFLDNKIDDSHYRLKKIC